MIFSQSITEATLCLSSVNQSNLLTQGWLTVTCHLKEVSKTARIQSLTAPLIKMKLCQNIFILYCELLLHLNKVCKVSKWIQIYIY